MALFLFHSIFTFVSRDIPGFVHSLDFVHDTFADFGKRVYGQKDERSDQRRSELIGCCFRTALFQAKPALQEAMLSTLERLEGAHEVDVVVAPHELEPTHALLQELAS